MKLSVLLSSILLFSTGAFAALEPLDNLQLQLVEGQAAAEKGAATINWKLSLNQTSTGAFDATTCANIEYCRLGVAFNNRNDATNKKQWMVFKGIQGSIELQDIEIAGADLVYTDDSNDSQIKAALKLSFNEFKPIKIRNLGFSALSIETDTVANEGAGNIPGYLAMGDSPVGTASAQAYSGGKYTDTTNQFDFGRETGFTGMIMNGNLALQGSLKVFSCDSTMKRC